MNDSFAELSGRLKRDCIAYITAKLMGDFYASLEDDRALDDEKNPNDLDGFRLAFELDHFLLQGETEEGDSVLRVIRERGNWSTEEQAALVEWQERAFLSVFEILEVTNEWLRLADMVSETEYQVYSNDNALSLRSVFGTKAKHFLLSHLAPIRGRWFLSGVQIPFPPEEEERLFTDFVQCQPPEKWYRDNPQKLARAFQTQKEHYDCFVSEFGTDELVGTGREIIQNKQRYWNTWNRHVGAPDPAPSSWPNDVEFVTENQVGLVMDEREGMHEFIDYDDFRKAFMGNKLTIRGRKMVKTYLEDETVPAFVFRRMKDRYPKGFRHTICNSVLPLTRNFDPVKDFELLMDMYKPDWKDVYPSVHPMNERFKKYYYRQAKPGRNELCPCHSGRKFKRCCGA